MKKRAKFILIGITLVMVLVGVFAGIALAADSPAATGDNTVPCQGQCANGTCQGQCVNGTCQGQCADGTCQGQCTNADCPNPGGSAANCRMSGSATGGCVGGCRMMNRAQ